MSKVIDKFGCLGNTIKVASGWYVDLGDPEPETIDIFTIASALSKMCRFGCQCPCFYSVAEHCVHAVGLAASDGYAGAALQAILLHDAAEAYLGDVTKPLKQLLPDYQRLEVRMEHAVAKRFNVDFVLNGDIIKKYDRIMLKAEKVALWPEDSEQWTGFAETSDRTINFGFWQPSVAFDSFMRMAKALKLFGAEEVQLSSDAGAE